MTSLFERLWADDRGAVISVELMLLMGILLFGMIPGLVAMRNSVNASFGTLGNILVRIVPSFTFSGWVFYGANGYGGFGGVGPAGFGGFGGFAGPPIAQVEGFQCDGNFNSQLYAAQVIPFDVGPNVVIPPAPFTVPPAP